MDLMVLGSFIHYLAHSENRKHKEQGRNQKHIMAGQKYFKGVQAFVFFGGAKIY